jgi:hypothetical protein
VKEIGVGHDGIVMYSNLFDQVPRNNRIGIERWVEINEVHAGIGKDFRIPQPLEIVAKKEAVHVLPDYQIFSSSSRIS